MNLSVDSIIKRVQPAITFLHRYMAFVCVVVFLGIYVYLVQHIGHLIQDEPSQSAIDSTLKPVNRLKIDQNAMQQITDLESQNIEVQALFEQARQNPFTE